MKYFTFLGLLLCLLASVVRADEPTGIRFFTGSWPEVLAEAKRQNKPIYVDFYTNWCPPCRRMAREAFPNPQIGAKFNEYFISYQVDAEAGEGVDLAKRFTVQSYPTALYIIPTGELVHRAVGYAGVGAMLQQADMILKMPKVRQSRRKRVHTTDLPISPAQPDTVAGQTFPR
ncbi:thioredoxin family protein [Spirosoma koreense]